MQIRRLHTQNDVGRLNTEDFKGKMVMIFVYLETCPYCVEMMPEWNLFKKKMESNRTRNRNLEILEINKELLKSIIKKDKKYFHEKLNTVQFVPMMSLYGKEKTYSYLGDRSCDDISEFTNRVLVLSDKESEKTSPTTERRIKTKVSKSIPKPITTSASKSGKKFSSERLKRILRTVSL